MSNTAEKNELQLVTQIPMLTRATKKTANGVPKLTVLGMQKMASRMRKRNQSIESMLAEQELDKAQMIAEAKKERIGAEKKGSFYKTLLVESEDDQPVKVTFCNKFSKINVKHESELKQALGNLYGQLYEKKNVVTMKENVDVDRLKSILGEDKFNSLFDVETHISAKEEFMEKRFYLRSNLKDADNNLVDGLIEQTQNKPSFSY